MTGKVVDSLQNTAVNYVVISVVNAADQKLINGALADSSGTFLVKDLKAGYYNVKISFIGYQDKWVSGVRLGDNQKLDLGIITIRESHLHLEEVVIKGQSDETAARIDKQVYKAAQFETAKGGTAIDAIKNMPSVSVNGEDEIRLRGSTGFLLLINGKPVITDAATVLRQIPANTIENIEIITSPSAKYDADGKSGIINITLKKGTDDGFTLILNGQGGLPSTGDFSNEEKPVRYGTDLTIGYKKGKWDLAAGGSYQRNDIAGRRTGDVNTTQNNIYTSFPSDGERSFVRKNYAFRASATYTINKKNSISAGIYAGQRQQFRKADIVYNNSRTDISNGQPLGSFSYYNANLVKKQGDFSLANLDYTHTFDNKSTLTFSGLYEGAVLDGFTKNLSTDVHNHRDTLDYVLNTGNSPLTGLRGKVDYAVRIREGKLESGYQFRYQKQTGAFLYQQAVLGSSQYQVIPEFSANINIENRIHGLYTQYSRKKDKLEYLVGLRYEYSTRVFSADKMTDAYRLELSNLFPSANVLYTLRPDFKIKAGFSSRVQRSTNNELNPYPEREHSETLEQGDPDIKPEFVYLSELGFVKEFTMGSWFANVYNQQISHVVNRVNSVYNDTILNRIYTNAGHAQQWGLESGLNVKPVKWWTAYAGANVYYYSIRGSLFNNTVTVSNAAVAYSINTNHTFALNKTLSLQLSLNYLSLRPTAQGEDSRFISPNASVKKVFLQGKVSASLLWQNIGLGFIPSNEQRITTSGSNFYTTTNYIQEKDVFLLNLSVNLNKQNRKNKLPVSEFGEREF